MTIINPHIHGIASVDPAHLALRKTAARASIAVAGFLMAVKLYAFLATDSVSVLSTLMDSTFDTLASIVTFFSVMHAARAADENHRFGHGKLEALSALGQGIFVSGTAAFLFYESIGRIITPRQIETPETGIAIMVISILLTLVLVRFQTYVIRKTQSVAIAADHLHYKGDLLLNISVIAALALSGLTTWPYFDPLFGIVIAVALFRGAKNIFCDSFDILMDKELPEEDRTRITALVTSHPAAQAVHDLRTRSTGERIFIEFHLELDGEMSLHKAHDVTEEIEKILFDAYPKSEVLIHQEPAGIADHRIDNVIQST